MATTPIKVERSARIQSPAGRASYPTLFVPRAFSEADDAKFSITLMVKKDDAGNAYKAAIEVIQEGALKTLLGTKKATNVERWGIKDGDDQDDQDMHGHWLIKATNKSRPAVVDADRAPVTDPEVIYGGCLVRTSVCAKAYGSPAKCGVALELVAVQKVGDGEPFSASARAKNQAVAEFDDATF
jgi:hypothetical protein